MPTVPGPYMFHQLVEEVMAVIAAGGVTPSSATLNQLKLALDAIYCARKSLFLAINASITLTAADSGKIIEYTGASSITVTLPTPVGNAGVNFRVENRATAGGLITLTTPSGAIYFYANSGASIAISTFYGVEVYSDGTSWVVKSSALQPISLGDGQTWQDVSLARAAGVSYTNTTAKPIEVSVSFQAAVVSVQVTLTVGGVIVQQQGSGAENSTKRTLQAIVPPNTNYVMTVTVGSIGALLWAELR